MCSTLQERRISGLTRVSGLGLTPRQSSPQELPPLVYDLRASEGSDDNYFSSVAQFADEVLEQIDKRCGAILDRFFFHSIDVLRDRSASRAQAAIDLLTAGATIALYANSARRVPGWALTELQKLSWKCGRPAMTAEMLHEALFRAFLKVDHGQPGEAERWARENPEQVLDELPRLIEWLQCTGDLAEVSRCVVNWMSALRTLPRKRGCEWIESVQELFGWFEPAAEAALGGYTKGVAEFLQSRSSKSNRREDRFLRGKRSVEYHLGMIAVEIANRQARRTFVRSPRKVVLLPACMLGAKARTCPGGQSYGSDVECTGCDSQCNVHRITQTMMAPRAEVYLQNCPRKPLRMITRWVREARIGLVVVACVPNLQALQLATRWTSMTCQFLPLDFPGCQSHWRKARIPTGLNQDELRSIVTDGYSRNR